MEGQEKIQVFHGNNWGVFVNVPKRDYDAPDRLPDTVFLAQLICPDHGNDTVYAWKENVSMRIEVRWFELPNGIAALQPPFFLLLRASESGEKHVMPTSQRCSAISIEHLSCTKHTVNHLLALLSHFTVRTTWDWPVFGIRMMTAIELE